MKGDDLASQSLALARSGRQDEAIAVGERAIRSGRADPGFFMFMGMLCGRAGKLAQAIDYLQTSVDRAPAETVPRVELARALLSAGRLTEADLIARGYDLTDGPLGREMWRICAHAMLRSGDVGGAIDRFEKLVDLDAADCESWDGLGAARLARGDVDGALQASEQATALRPTAAAFWINFARIQGAKGNFPSAIGAAKQALSLVPNDPAAFLELARAQSGSGASHEALITLNFAQQGEPNPELLSEVADVEFNCKSFENAEAHYRAAIAASSNLRQAWLGLGKLLERLNRTEELLEMVDEAEAAGVDPADLRLLRAQGLRGAGRHVEALEQLEMDENTSGSVARWQLVGKLADRLGRSEQAFAAFAEANRLLKDETNGVTSSAKEYRDRFVKMAHLLTPQFYARWRPGRPAFAAGQDPAFIFGFPRSGTTLIDTMLSGHANLQVLEEEAAIDLVATSLGPMERIAHLSETEIAGLRRVYFDEVARIAPGAARKTIIDKHPLGLGSTPILHKIFPGARFVFVERHPYDVVLSCFITSADMDVKIGSFFDLEQTAMLYDRVMTFWSKCRNVMDIDVQTIRYEMLIADPETEMRKLTSFLNVRFDESVLDHQSSAASRRYIGSPSYAQVAEPIYARASGRWLRYRQHLKNVMPILAPWVDRLNYGPWDPENQN